MFGKLPTSDAGLATIGDPAIAIREKRTSAVAAPHEGDPTHPRMVIAVESPAVRKVIKHMITALGWRVTETAALADCVELAIAAPAPHGILIDFSSAQAAATCWTIKRNEQCQLIPIMAITCDDSGEQKLRALEAGVDDFISQPIHRADLIVRLRALLRMQRSNQELIGAESVALALARAVAAKDGYAQKHVEEVAGHAVELGRAMGMDVGELKVLRYGAILHNVGKIAIPDAVLEKTEALTPREMAMFQQHPRVGCDICSPLKPLRPVLPIIRHHKERWDGAGYPDGLQGPEIPLGAQIVGIVNTFVAMTSNRPYRRALSFDDAIRFLRANAASGAYDPPLVETFIKGLKKKTEQSSDSPTAEQMVASGVVIPTDSNTDGSARALQA